MTETKHDPQTLRFDADRGASRSTWIAGALVVAIVGWMGSDFILPSQKTQDRAKREDPRPVTVAVRPSVAGTATQFFQGEGQALPDRDTMLRAEVSGDIVEVLASKGQEVEAGAVIARFDPTGATADLRRAGEELARAQCEFDIATQLPDRGVATADRLAQARASLASAEAQVTAAHQAAENLAITAPFCGRIETLGLDPGEFVSAGSEIGRIVDNKPLTVAIQAPQQSLTRIRNGQAAKVRFITGEERDGVVSFVGTSAAAETRTFLAGIKVDNEDRTIPAGVSAEVPIPTGEVTAHFVSPSIVSLRVGFESHG